MFDSLYNDLKRNFEMGNMVTKIIFVQLSLFVLFALIKAFTPGDSLFYSNLISYLGCPSSFSSFIYKPWTIFTYMWIHLGFWDTIFSVLVIFIFGRITGDLLGDYRILPLFILGGVFGTILMFLFNIFMPNGYVLFGSAPAVMSIAMVAAMVAPDYQIRLLLLGDVKIKYIVGVFLLLILLGTANKMQALGYVARMGGLVMGVLYIYLLRSGTDLAEGINKIITLFSLENSYRKPVKKSKMKVAYRSGEQVSKENKIDKDSNQERIDQILDKINKSGYESLTDEEKEYLFLASKNNN